MLKNIPRLRRPCSTATSMRNGGRIPDGMAVWRVVTRHSAVRFALVGCTNTLISFTVFRVMLCLPYASTLKVAASQLVSYGAGVAWSYCLNRVFTFRSKRAWGSQAARFVLLQASLAIGSSVVIGSLVERGGRDPSFVWFAVMAVVTAVNYAFSRAWVFR
jgi:putative flippase GtrA